MSNQDFSGSSSAMLLAALVPGSPPNRYPCQATDVNDRGPVAVDGQLSRCGPLLPTE